MSAQELEAALAAPDSSTARSHLSQLASHDLQLDSVSHPTITEMYLQAFCNVSVPAAKRRWIGLIICKLLDNSFGVMEPYTTPKAKKIKLSPKSKKAQQGQHPQQNPKSQFSQIGRILTRGNELEETKIVAGLIIRQALLRGIEFGSLWPSDKVPLSAPGSIFPQGNSLDWIQSFQSYLDILSSLKLMEPGEDPASDPTILYPLCLSTDDGFRWRDPEPVIPISLIEDGSLTVITPDSEIRNFNFVDVPLGHILCINKRKSVLHDSQGEKYEHEPWDLALLLKSNTWTYSLNATERTGKELVIMFEHQEDATECEKSINEWRARSTAVESETSPQQHAAENANGHPLSQLDGMGYESGREPATNGTVSKSLHDHAETQGTAKRATDNSEQLLAGLEPDHIPHEVCVGVSATTDDTTKETANKQRKGLKKNVLASINNSKVNGHVPIVHEDVFAFPDEGSPMDHMEVAASGRSARNGKHPITTAKLKSKLPQVKAKPATKSRSGPQGPHRGGEDNVLRSPELVPNTSVSKQASKSAKTTKRCHDEDDEQENCNVSSGHEPEQRKRRRAAKKVTYNEEETSDDPKDSDFIATEPKNHHTVGKKTAARNDRLPRKHSKGVTAKTMKSKNTSESQSISPAKHIIVSSLQSKSLHERNSTQPPSSSPLVHNAKEAIPKHSALLKGQFIRKSERQTLDRLNDLSDGSEDAAYPLLNGEGCKLGHTLANHKSCEELGTDIEGITAVPTVEPSRVPNTTASQKRCAPSTPVHTPKAKRYKADFSPKSPTTMAPPRRLEEPNSPCPKTYPHRSPYVRTKATAGMASKVHIEPTQLAKPEQDLHLTSKAICNGVEAEVRTPTTNGFQRTSSGSSEIMLLLSSNSKPLPAPPTAESTAISGHSSRRYLKIEEMNEAERNKDNPFLCDSVTSKAKSFARHLAASMHHFMKPEVQGKDCPKTFTSAHPKMSAQQNVVIELEGDTLIGEEEDEPVMNASPILVRSSPPKIPSSPSSHSSTSAEGEAEGEVEADSYPSTSKEEAEDREWEESLKPYQRTIGTQLTRISRRLLRHIVDNETAVNDIAQTYSADAHTLFDSVQARRNEHFEASIGDIKKSSADVKRKLEALAAKIRADRKGPA